MTITTKQQAVTLAPAELGFVTSAIASLDTITTKKEWLATSNRISQTVRQLQAIKDSKNKLPMGSTLVGISKSCSVLDMDILYTFTYLLPSVEADDL